MQLADGMEDREKEGILFSSIEEGCEKSESKDLCVMALAACITD